MAVVVTTLNESNIKDGKVFDFIYTETDLDDNDFVDIVICTNDDNLIINKVIVEGKTETSSWQAFAGPVFTGGDAVQAIPKNQRKTAPYTVSVVANPTITAEGQPFTVQPIELVAEMRGTNAYLSEIILSNYVVPAGACLLYTSPSPRDRQKSRMPSSA